MDPSCLSDHDDSRRILAVFFTGLVLVYVFYFRLGWSPAPLGRLDVFYSAPPTVTGFYLIDTLIARDFEAFRSALSQLILPATTLAIFSLAPIARRRAPGRWRCWRPTSCAPRAPAGCRRPP